MPPAAASDFADIRPQAGPQEKFLSTSADIAIYGGQAYGGKTFGILLDPLRFVHVKGFGAVIFRRNSIDITQEGGLWDEARGLYPLKGGRPRESQGKLDYRFPWGTRISFSHLQYEESVTRKQGGQIAMMGFDELTHFLESQFFYMLSRLRSQCGIRPYVRATCNPDPDSWVAKFIAWWIDQEPTLEDGTPNPRYGLPIPERSGVIRWMIKTDDDIQWFDSKKEALQWAIERGISNPKPKSVTFIPASRYDNPIGMEKDPDYEGNLQLLGRVDRARLMDGNWKIRKTAGLVFNRHDFEIIELEDFKKIEHDVMKRIRRWDFGGTEAKRAKNPKTMSSRLINNPDWTVGLKAVLMRDKTIVMVDMIRDRLKPGAVKQLVIDTAKTDGKKVKVIIPEDPGQAGKAQVEDYAKALFGFTMKEERETGSKLTRAEPYAAYAEHGNVKLLRASWNDVFLSEHDAFPTDGVKDDIVDCGSGAYKELTEKGPSTTDMIARARQQGRI